MKRFVVIAIRDFDALKTGLAQWRGCYIVDIRDNEIDAVRIAYEEEQATGGKYGCEIRQYEDTSIDLPKV